VALMSSRSVSGRVIAWPRGESLPDLPVVQQVARAAPGPRTEIVTALIADIANELGDFTES